MSNSTNFESTLDKKTESKLQNTESKILSVEQLNFQIKQLLEGEMGQVWVQGEVSNFKAHTSGHYYFSLKDSKSQISAVMFRGFNSKLKFKITDGLEVIVRGRLSVYEPRGNYQILCEFMEPVGAGALQKAFEQLKTKLKSEGLFEASRKKPIPLFPHHIAIVTSPTGAAIRDILNVLSRRANSIEVTIVPTLVQGEGSAVQICEAFDKAIKLPNVDVIIVGRGGGSIEDLWAFNDETLARKIAASKIPVISAVGHEIDFTISDFVADLRAPTPSAAAELVAKSSVELNNKILNLKRLLHISLEKKLKSIQQQLNFLVRGLIDPRRKLQDYFLRNDELRMRLDLSALRILESKKNKIVIATQKIKSPQIKIDSSKKEIHYLISNLQTNMSHMLENKKFFTNQLMGLLDSLSPLKVVDRGYAIISSNKKIIKSVDQLEVGDPIHARLAHGEIDAKITKIYQTKGD